MVFNVVIKEFLIKFLGAGKIEKDPRNSVVSLIVTKFSDVNNIIIPFFEKNPLLGVKLMDFLDWCKVANLMIEKKHLTKDGVDLIRKIQCLRHWNEFR